jgi:hypothetical protein
LTEYFAELSVKLLDSDRGAALSMWTGFCKEIFSQRQKMMAVSTTKDTKGLVLLNTLRLKDWGLWDDIIASMAGAKHDLLDTFFEDVCEELLMSKITFDQVEKGSVRSSTQANEVVLIQHQDHDVDNPPSYTGPPIRGRCLFRRLRCP